MSTVIDRAAFERYFATSRKSKGAGRRPTFERRDDDTYADDHTQRHWWTWQNALRAALDQPAPEAQPVAAAAMVQRIRREAEAWDAGSGDLAALLREAADCIERMPAARPDPQPAPEAQPAAYAPLTEGDMGVIASRATAIGEPGSKAWFCALIRAVEAEVLRRVQVGKAPEAQPVARVCEPLGMAVVDFIADDGMRSAHGGIYQTRVQDFATEVQIAFAQQNGLRVRGADPAPEAQPVANVIDWLDRLAETPPSAPYQTNGVLRQDARDAAAALRKYVAAPAQPAYVPLTEGDIVGLTEHIDTSRNGYFIHIARAVESAVLRRAGVKP